MSRLRCPHAPTCATARGFTLAELMAVVAIMAVLATLGMVGYRKYINSARSSEAMHMIAAIRAAQEAYRSETLTYLDVSTRLDRYYPTNTPGEKKVAWGGDGADPALAQQWRILNVTTDGPVYFAYATIAGGPGDIVAQGLSAAFTNALPQAVEPWYIVQAMGDVNGDGVPSHCVATSFSNELHWHNEGE